MMAITKRPGGPLDEAALEVAGRDGPNLELSFKRAAIDD